MAKSIEHRWFSPAPRYTSADSDRLFQRIERLLAMLGRGAGTPFLSGEPVNSPTPWARDLRRP